MSFKVVALSLVVLVLSPLVSAQIFIDTLMHTDSHIIDHNWNLADFIKTHLIANGEGLSTFEITPTAPNFEASWTNTLKRALSESNATDVYVLVSSHGDKGQVMFNDRLVPLSFLTNELAKAVKESEQRGVPRRIHFIYSACFSGSIFSDLKKSWSQYGVQSTISIIASATEHILSHSTVLHTYFLTAMKRIKQITENQLSYCDGCTMFEKLGRLIGAGRATIDDDVPTFWSSDARARTTTFTDFQTELKLFSPASVRITQNPSQLFAVLNSMNGSRLFQYFYQESPYMFANYSMQFVAIETLISQKIDGAELAAELLKLFPKEHSQWTRTTLVESLMGWIAGWLLMDSRIKYKTQFYDHLNKNWDVQDRPHIIGALRSVKVRLLLERKQFRRAVQEFVKLADIPVGWQHSASPSHDFVRKSARLLYSDIFVNAKLPESERDRFIRQLLKNPEAGHHFVKIVFEMTHVPVNFQYHPDVMKFLIVHSHGLDGLPSRVDRIAAIKAFASFQNDQTIISEENRDMWIKSIAKSALFDGEIETANKYLGLNLPYRLGESNYGKIPFYSESTLRCEALFLFVN